MNRLWILMLVLACPGLVLGQERVPGTSGAGDVSRSYRPAVAAPTANVYGGGGWGGYGGASTAAGSAMQGMSQVISSAGQYNLNTSAAAINMTQAQSNAMQNQVQACNTFWELRNIGRAQRAAERGPDLTPEQLARIAHSGIPRALTPSQLDPVTGRLNWPDALQDPSFQPQRSELDPLFVKLATYGGLDYADKTQVRENVNSMFDGLKALIRQIPPPDYVACRTFLQSMLYAATKTALQ